jgi:GNAT superfamily N-acetyltransferase
VAIDTSGGDEEVVGAAALAPASDPDLDADSCVELLVLTVDPERRGTGHGSRLLTAALQTAAADGEREAVVWVASADDSLRRFLEAAGWAADGAFRTLATDGDGDAAELRQVRLGTSLETSR